MPPGGPGTVLRPGGAQVIPRPHLWWAVPHPTPAPYPLHVSTDDVVRAVQAQPCSRPNIAPDADSLPAAVLVVLADGPDGEAGVLLTRRSQLMRRNPGEISFPGGRLDPGETPEQAAVREAYEEVGLDPAAVELVGSLDHLATVVHPSFVVPVVGRTATQLELVPTSIEAERVLWVPLADLVRPDTFHVERWGRQPSSRLLFFFELDDETVWGLTAFVLTDLLERLAPAAA